MIYFCSLPVLLWDVHYIVKLKTKEFTPNIEQYTELIKDLCLHKWYHLSLSHDLLFVVFMWQVCHKSVQILKSQLKLYINFICESQMINCYKHRVTIPCKRSFDFTWNPPDFTWNPADFTWNPADFMKSLVIVPTLHSSNWRVFAETLAFIILGGFHRWNLGEIHQIFSRWWNPHISGWNPPDF